MIGANMKTTTILGAPNPDESLVCGENGPKDIFQDWYSYGGFYE
jgi:hypothetical protein